MHPTFAAFSWRQIMRVYSTVVTLQNASKFCHQRVATALLQSMHLTFAASWRSKALRCRKIEIMILILCGCYLLSLISSPQLNLHNNAPTTAIDKKNISKLMFWLHLILLININTHLPRNPRKTWGGWAVPPLPLCSGYNIVAGAIPPFLAKHLKMRRKKIYIKKNISATLIFS